MRTHVSYLTVIAALIAVIVFREPPAPPTPLPPTSTAPASQPIGIQPTGTDEKFFGVWRSSKDQAGLVLEADGVWGWHDPEFDEVIKLDTGWFVREDILVILGGETHPHLPQNLAMTFAIRTAPDGTITISASDFGDMTRVGATKPVEPTGTSSSP